MTAITRAIWIRDPRLKMKNPSSHKIKRIIPITNKIPTFPPIFLTLIPEYSEIKVVNNLLCSSGQALRLKEPEISFASPIIMKIIEITRAKWIKGPRLRTKNPMNHETKRIKPKINNI
jgi:hypothetical protein